MPAGGPSRYNFSMTSHSPAQVELIREAFHYQSRFDGSTMVFKVDFPVTEDIGFAYFVKDLALLAKTGFKVAIVPGSKEWIDSVLNEYGIVSAYRGAERITAAAAMPFVEMAAMHVGGRFMTALSANRVDALVGNFVRARGLGVLNGVDMEQTGTVDKILTGPIERVMGLGMVPILPCIGWGASGKPYNVLSDEIALAAAAALGAVKLFIVSAHQSIHSDVYKMPENSELEDGRLIRLTPKEAELFLELNAAGGDGGNEDKALKEIRLALRASRAGVERVHIIDGREDGAVLRELFSNMGAGTMVYTGDYEAVRPLKSQDIPDVLRLMEPLMQQGILIRRDAEAIRSKKDDYAVFEIDGSVHACGALHLWGSQGEIAAVATEPGFADMGLGRKIVGYLIGRAEKLGLSRVFVLTTRTRDWFEFLGFRESTVESLPEERQKLYDQKRRSKVFALKIE